MDLATALAGRPAARVSRTEPAPVVARETPKKPTSPANRIQAAKNPYATLAREEAVARPAPTESTAIARPAPNDSTAIADRIIQLRQRLKKN